MSTRPTILSTLVVALLLLGSSLAVAQDEATEHARQLLSEAQAHYEGGRRALAAETYLQLYESLRESGSERASIALWNAGEALAEVAGRERDAIDTLRRFLDESTTLTDDPDVRDWRSEAVSLIDELEARTGAGEVAADTPVSDQENTTGPDQTQESTRETSVSPVGPTLLGVGGATLLAGAIVGGVLVSENDALVARCPGGTCPTDARDQADGVHSLAIATDVLVIGGALIAATGLVLTLVLVEEQEDEGPTVAVGGACGSEGCSITARGSF